MSARSARLPIASLCVPDLAAQEQGLQQPALQGCAGDGRWPRAGATWIGRGQSDDSGVSQHPGQERQCSRAITSPATAGQRPPAGAHSHRGWRGQRHSQTLRIVGTARLPQPLQRGAQRGSAWLGRASRWPIRRSWVVKSSKSLGQGAGRSADPGLRCAARPDLLGGWPQG